MQLVLKIKSAITKISKKIFSPYIKLSGWAGLCIGLFFAYGDMHVYNFRVPSKGQLTVSSGTIRVTHDTTNRNSQLHVPFLVTDTKRQWKGMTFKCHIYFTYPVDCLSYKTIKEYKLLPNFKINNKNKNAKKKLDSFLPHNSAKVWWYRFKSVDETPLLMQLEINGNEVLSYEEQRNKYLSMQSKHAYLGIILLLISLAWLYLVLHAEDDRDEKNEA